MPEAPAGHDRELLVFATPPARPGDGGFLLDKKFVSGMAHFKALWKGPIRCALFIDPNARPPFAQRFNASALPFSVSAQNDDGPPLPTLIEGAALVLATGEAANAVEIGRECRKRTIPCVYIVENTLSTRVAIALLERQQSWLRRLKTAAWHVFTEPARRRTLRQATGIQANGAPAARAYGPLNPETITFFDTRTTAASLPSSEALEARLAGLPTQRPLRLVFSGRLVAIKGVDHLPRVMSRLAAQGVAASLDIFGSGPLEAGLRDDIERRGLSKQVRLRGEVDFDRELTPYIRENADIFLCCHLQADPSCSYLETLACGVPIAGYANQAFTGILKRADIGWAAPVGAADRLARMIRRAARTPGEVAAKSRNALAFARTHTFESAWALRIDQLKRLAGCNQ